MDTLVPSYIPIEGTSFPLEVNQSSIFLEKSIEELEPLRYALSELVNGSLAARSLETVAREGFSIQELSAKPVKPNEQLWALWDGPVNWLRISGSWPDPWSSFWVSAGFISRELLVPHSVFMALLARLRELRADIIAGRRESRTDGTPVPPPRPLTPELEIHQNVRDRDHKAAQLYREAMWLCHKRADEDIADDVLRALEDLSATVDRLDAEASAGDEPYADDTLTAAVTDQRDRLLLALEIAGVFGRGLRERLASLGLEGLVAYCDAAVEMDGYLSSAGHARLVGEGRPDRLNHAGVSLDWFRRPSKYSPTGVTPDDWLALCERNFEDARRPSAGSLFVKLERAFHRLLFRTELGMPKLYRAVPA